jgi:hypothetical protein
VRVREVGVGRERRTRMNQAPPLDNPTPPSSVSPPTDEIPRSLSPALPAPPHTPPPVQRPPSPPPTRSKPVAIPYSSFQQLDTIVPNLPSAILSSSWVIPPLYVDVIGLGGSRTIDTRNGEGVSSFQNASTSTATLPPQFDPTPLLSPVSLINPIDGLFFVTRGNNLTGIVDSQGKSILKRPIIFNPEPSMVAEAYQRIEVLLVENGRKTVIVGIGPKEVKAVLVGGSSLANLAVQVVTGGFHHRSSGSDVKKDTQFLAKVRNQLFFSEKTGNSYSVYCLSSL